MQLLPRLSHLSFVRRSLCPKYSISYHRRGAVLQSVQRWNSTNTLSALRLAFSYQHISKRKEECTETETTGILNKQDLKSSDGFRTYADKAFKQSATLRQQIYKCEPGVQVVELMDELSDTLCAVVDLTEFVRNVHPTADYRRACEDICQRTHAHFEELNTDTKLSDALRRVTTLPEFTTYDYEVQRTANLFLFDFEQSAIDGSKKERDRVQKLTSAINQLGMQFVHATQTERGQFALPLSDASILPLPAVSQLPKTQTPDGASAVVVKTPGYAADRLLSTSSNPKVRRALYLATYPEDSARRRCLSDLLRARHFLALTTGYRTYGHKALADTMAESPDIVTKFLHEIASALTPLRVKESTMLQRLKATHEKVDEPLMPWDRSYYTSIARTSTRTTQGTCISEYFELGAVMEGLADMHRSLYDIDIVLATPLKGELWDPQVVKLKVVEGSGDSNDVLGYIYADLFHRHDKTEQPSQFTIRSGRRISDSEYQTPVVGLVCSLAPPSESLPTLLSHNELSTLFHEMGHAIHCILGRTRFHHVAGTRCKIDFVEIPSIMNEFFVWDYRVLCKFAKHYRTGETLPVSLLDGLKRDRQQTAASETLSQVLYALGDQVLHGSSSFENDRPLATLPYAITGYPHASGSAWELYFSHMYTYGASYYTYLWSKAFANLIWKDCFSTDPLSRETGTRYRKEMLAHGGGAKPWVMVENMLGYKPDLKHLVNSVVYGHTHV
eukprot:CFRG3040T1